jgi:hypothetical protein
VQADPFGIKRNRMGHVVHINTDSQIHDFLRCGVSKNGIAA